MDKADKPSVCFFMLYYKRPEITRMSLWHMAKVKKKFEEAGHECEAIAIGDEEDQKAYCKKLGITHIDHKNNPLPEKFKAAWQAAMDSEKDYICWLGSNNVHSDDFWDKCLKQINSKKTPTFGTTNFTVVDNDFSNQRTKTWIRRRYNFCSAGQFFFRVTLKKSVDFDKVFATRKKNTEEGKDFDGSINLAIHARFGKEAFVPIHSEPLDCIDIKSDFDMHPFKNYDVGMYDQNYTRDEIYSKFEELQMLESREFSKP